MVVEILYQYHFKKKLNCQKKISISMPKLSRAVLLSSRTFAYNRKSFAKLTLQSLKKQSNQQWQNMLLCLGPTTFTPTHLQQPSQ
jgi:hypothetical protein